MKLSCLILCLILPFAARGQTHLYQKKEVTKTEIQTLYSFYLQDGEHSAVTGGKGTEKLRVYGLATSLDISKKRHHLLFDLNIDIISSASTDKIDFVLSSASEHDSHLSLKAGYQKQNKDNRVFWGGKYLFGIESDYLSHGMDFWIELNNVTNTRTWRVQSALLYDDLRWGRLNGSQNYKPTTLIYPAELRDKRWFDIYTRTSYNGSISLKQDLNTRSSLMLSTGIIHQTGLLSTPFHRVYFINTSAPKVERLPEQRTRIPIAMQLNLFATNALIIKSAYRYYADSYGSRAHTVSIEAPVKLSNVHSLYPLLRFHWQSAVKYFKPYGQHQSTELYYTSDYDLSTLKSFSAGLGIGSFPGSSRSSSTSCVFQKFMVRYLFYWRSDGMSAHSLSSSFGWQHKRTANE